MTPNPKQSVNLPLLQREPFHPTTHPQSHWPVTWLHVVFPLQWPLHILLHSTPYLPTAHSFRANYISLVYPKGIKVFISLCKLFLTQCAIWLDPKLYAQNVSKKKSRKKEISLTSAFNEF